MEQKQDNQVPQSHDSHTSMEDERVLASVSSDGLYRMLTKDINDWDFSSKHTTTHDPTGYEFWTCNGWISFRVYERQNIGINFIDKIRLWYWLKNARRVQISQIIKSYEIR